MRNKEEVIIFQNQSHLVQQHFKNCGVCPTLLDIALATDIMVQFVSKGYSDKLKDRFDNFEIYIDEKYRGGDK